MPLIDANTPPTSTDTHYVVYFASGEPSWCPDCRDALPALNAVFGGASDPTAYIVRVGSREEWRGTPKNKYRNAPYNINGVPTVVKVQNVSLISGFSFPCELMRYLEQGGWKIGR